jgi:hypothetical protein
MRENYAIDILATDRASASFKSAKASARAFEQGVENLHLDIDRLRGEMDPLYRANQRYAQQQAVVRRAVQGRILAEREGVQILDQLATRHQQQIAQLNRVTGTTVVAGRGMGRFSIIAQQAGFQVGDFATQVASGQRAMVAFTQQAPQFLGFFGATGAVVGAAVAILGGLAIAFQRSNEASREGKSANNQYRESLEDMQLWLVKVTEGEREYQKAIANRRLETRQAVLDDEIRKLQEIEQKIRSLEAQASGNVTGSGNTNLDRLQRRAALRLEEQTKQFTAQKFVVGQVEAAVVKLQQRISEGILTDSEGLPNDDTGNAERRRSLELQFLREQAAAIKISQQELAIVERIHSGFEVSAANVSPHIRAQAEEFVRLRNEIDAARQAQVKHEQEQRKASSQFNRLTGGLDEFALTVGRDPFEAEIARVRQQEEEKLAIARQALELRVTSEEEAAMRMAQIHQQAAIQINQLERQRQDESLRRGEEFFGNLGGVVGQFVDQNSKAYKAIFAAHKAFSLGRAIINQQEAITRALAEPFPLNIGLLAQVVATTAGAIGTIRGTGFMSGGFTGNAPRSQAAGIVHGQEFVVRAGPASEYRGMLEGLNRTGKLPNMRPAVSGAPRITIINQGTPQTYEVESVTADEVRVIARDEINRSGPAMAVRAVSADLAGSYSRTREGLMSRTNVRERR